MKELADLAPVITGSLLTIVLGGVLGFLFQNRSWDHQHKIQRAEQERERAVGVFDEVSRLMDKRLYRLKLVYWSLKDESSQPGRSPLAETRFEDYRRVLYDWNDSINRNLALLERYFGTAIRNELDRAVGASFVTLGNVIESWWKTNTRPDNVRSFEVRLRELSDLVYGFNLKMIRAIQAEPGQLLAAQRGRE
jgi:hypothetical protein